MNINDLVHQYGSYIHNYALRLSCNPTTAEDLSQETFIQAWKSMEQLQNPDAIKAWLRKICLNAFFMKMRKEQGHTEVPFEDFQSLEADSAFLCSTSLEPTPEDEVIVDESIRELQNGCFLAMVRRLTLNQRITFSLIDMFGLSIDEVAELMSFSKPAVKGLLYRARMNLDDFFHSRCSLIKVNNPCSCEAWIGFAEQRSDMQNQVLKKKLVTALDYKKSNYTFNPAVRKKVQQLYQSMPDKKPTLDWYHSVVALIGEMYSQK